MERLGRPALERLLPLPALPVREEQRLQPARAAALGVRVRGRVRGRGRGRVMAAACARGGTWRGMRGGRAPG